MAFIRSLIFVLFCCLFPGCAIQPVQTPNLMEVLDRPDPTAIKLRMREDGLIFAENIEIGDQKLTFLIDTGATRSAIFETPLKTLTVNNKWKSRALIHGIIESGKRDIVTVPKLSIGDVAFIDQALVILTDRDSGPLRSEEFDGLIGMDILSNYKLYASPENSDYRLIRSNIALTIPSDWERVPLIENPFKDDQRTLHFMELRIAGKLTTTLLDTGSEFSIMNWNTAQYSQLRSLKRRLRKKWELQGAVGRFKPIAKINLGRFRGGKKFWNKKQFLVMDFNSLDILGIGEEAFIVGGMNLFKDEAFLIDFENNVIAIKPVRRRGQTRYSDQRP